MNLTKLFNFSYLKENLKKSKVTLAFVLLILPILNLVIFLMTSSDDYVSVFDLNYVSALTILGMYILPIVLSIILFSFVFKKKAVDFMGSMPIDRKTIFFTNTLGGIIIIALLLFITVVLMMVANFILPNVYVPMGVFLDYYLIFLISYIFVFTISNIGVSLSGNVATALVVTALVMFLVPFNHFAYEKILTNEYSYNYLFNYKCNDCSNLNEIINKNDDDLYHTYLEKVEDEVNYTMPFEMIAKSFDTSSETQGVEYEDSTIGKMAILSLLYILVGYLLFEKREMEVCETSFKKFSTHQVVKFLTMLPILVVVSKILENANLMAFIFTICLLLIYNFVYDLITRHSIVRVKSNLISFALVFVGVISVCAVIINNDTSQVIKKDFSINDIEGVYLELNMFNYYNDEKLVSIKNDNLKKKIVEGLLVENMANLEAQKDKYHIEVEVIIKGNRYAGTSLIEKEVYEQIKNDIVKSNIAGINTLKDIVKSSEVITIDNDYVSLDKEGVKKLEKVANKKEESSNNTFSIPLSIYLYKNHKLEKYTISNNIDNEFQKYVVNQYNQKSKEVDFKEIHNVEVVNAVNPNGYYYGDSALLAIKNNFKNIINQQINFSETVYKISLYRNGSPIYFYANLDKEILDKMNNYSSFGDKEYYGY